MFAMAPWWLALAALMALGAALEQLAAWTRKSREVAPVNTITRYATTPLTPRQIRLLYVLADVANRHDAMRGYANRILREEQEPETTLPELRDLAAILRNAEQITVANNPEEVTT